MTDRTGPRSSDPNSQATYWLTLLTSGRATKKQQQEFELWLSSDPAHKLAWKRAQAMWRELDALGEADVADIERRARMKRRQASRRSACSLWPAAAAVVLLIGFWVVRQPSFYADYYTVKGARLDLNLAEGSRVWLDTQSAVSVDFSATVRRIKLHEGEAYFEVARDPARRFEVETPAGRVRALGTAFNIRLDSDGSVVTVFEHAVSVEPRRGAPIERLEQGERARFGSFGVTAPEEADLEQAAAWRDNRLVFEDRPLLDVVQELNRYRPGRIVILDRALQSTPLTGVFDTRDPDQALEMIQRSLSLRSIRLTDALVILLGSA
jgi:transmembrane sensor